MDDRATLRRLPGPRLTWLRSESSRWVSDGIIDLPAREKILAGYADDTRPHRGTLALILMAVVMCGVGVLLVIGYNWQRIGPAVKIALVMTAVAAAFAASAFAYTRRHHTAGEVLAFAGTLLFGNGIWLIAQALHIQGHFPDGFLWFAVGSLLCAWLIGSRAIGVQAAILLGVWIAGEGTVFPRPIYAFLVLWPAAIWVCYQVRSPVMLRILALGAGLWVLVSNVRPGHSIGWSGAVALAGCALYAAGRWHAQDRPLGNAWRTAGLAVVLAGFIPLMTGHLGGRSAPGFDPGVVITALVAAAALSVAARMVSPVDWTIAISVVLTAAWTLALRLGGFPEAAWRGTAAKVLFSALALALSVSLIRNALRSNRTSDLVFGLLFGLAFVVVRWASVLENLLWSGLFLLIAGGGLLFVARLWLRRDGHVIAGRAT
jgi:uncharacterized membrane protein